MLSRISTLYCKLFPLCITWPSVGFGESSLAISDNKIRGFFICRRPKSQDKHNSAFSKQLRSPSIIGYCSRHCKNNNIPSGLRFYILMFPLC